jgi:hypothetical protein
MNGGSVADGVGDRVTGTASGFLGLAGSERSAASAKGKDATNVTMACPSFLVSNPNGSDRTSSTYWHLRNAKVQFHGPTQRPTAILRSGRQEVR